MCGRIVVLGGGHGVASVLHALREDPVELTVIVTVADDGGSSGELRRRWGGPAVGDVRRSLIALAGEDTALARAFAQPLATNGLGRHPLGNLVIHSLTGAFGDIETATEWLRGRLGISAHVLPASAEPVWLLADGGDDQVIFGESAIGAARIPIRRLRFEPECPRSPVAALQAIDHADWILLAPGSLFTSTLAATALPDVASAIARTRARVLWICNLEPEQRETAGMTAADHLAAVRSHGVRVDAVLYDPGASLQFATGQLAREQVPAIARRLRARQPGTHDPVLLHDALHELFTGVDIGMTQRASARVTGREPRAPFRHGGRVVRSSDRPESWREPASSAGRTRSSIA
jgi:uncharacterized cofD-like protein